MNLVRTAQVVAVIVIQYQMDDHGSPWPSLIKTEYLFFSGNGGRFSPPLQGLSLLFEKFQRTPKKEG